VTLYFSVSFPLLYAIWYFEQAMQYVQQALSMQPNSQQALVCLVYLELRSGNTESAVDIVKKQRVPSGFKHDD